MIPWMWNSGITVERAVGGGELQRRGDVARRAGQVALAQRHDLRP